MRIAALLVPQSAIFTIKGRDSILLAEQPISIAKLTDLLELKPQTPNPTPYSSPPSPALFSKRETNG